MLWTQVITGLEVDDLTAVHVLDAASVCKNSAARRSNDAARRLGSRKTAKKAPKN